MKYEICYINKLYYYYYYSELRESEDSSQSEGASGDEGPSGHAAEPVVPWTSPGRRRRGGRFGSRERRLRGGRRGSDFSHGSIADDEAWEHLRGLEVYQEFI